MCTENSALRALTFGVCNAFDSPRHLTASAGCTWPPWVSGFSSGLRQDVLAGPVLHCAPRCSKGICQPRTHRWPQFCAARDPDSLIPLILAQHWVCSLWFVYLVWILLIPFGHSERECPEFIPKACHTQLTVGKNHDPSFRGTRQKVSSDPVSELPFCLTQTMQNKLVVNGTLFGKTQPIFSCLQNI